MTKKAMEKSFHQNLHVLPAGSGSFFSSSVLFFEQICWMLSRESKIINFVGPDKRRLVVYHQLNEGEHLKTLFLWNFTARTRLLLRNQGTFGLYYCFVLRVASTNNCGQICSNVSLAFCDGVVLCRVFASLIILIFHQDIFYLGSKVLFRLLPLSSLLEFKVFSDFLNFSVFTDLMMHRR